MYDKLPTPSWVWYVVDGILSLNGTSPTLHLASDRTYCELCDLLSHDSLFGNQPFFLQLSKRKTSQRSLLQSWCITCQTLASNSDQNIQQNEMQFGPQYNRQLISRRPNHCREWKGFSQLLSIRWQGFYQSVSHLPIKVNLWRFSPSTISQKLPGCTATRKASEQKFQAT